MMRQRGFTIIEVLLFLSISSLLMVIALVAITGSINSTRFTDATHSLEAFLTQQYSEVQAGVSYRSDAPLSCASGLSPDAPGAADNCIVLGRLIEFIPSSEFGQANTIGSLESYTVVGRRCPDTPRPDENGCAGGSGSSCPVSDASEPGRLAAYCPRAIRSAYHTTHELQWGTHLLPAVTRAGLEQPNPAVRIGGSTERFNRLAILHSPTSERVYTYTFSSPDSFDEVESEYAIPRSALNAAHADKEAIMCLSSQSLLSGLHYISLAAGQGSDLITSGEGKTKGALQCS